MRENYYWLIVILIWCSIQLSSSGVIAQQHPCRYPEDPLRVTVSPAAICPGQTATLRLEGGGGGDRENVAWYTGSCGGSLVGKGNPLEVRPSETTTYIGRYENDAPCEFYSSCRFASLTVIQEAPIPDSATANPPLICQGQLSNLTLFATGNRYDVPVGWYTGSCKGVKAGMGNNLTVSPPVTTTYFGRYETDGPCGSVSPCQSVTLKVMEKPSGSAFAKASPAIVCRGGQVVLSLEGGNAGSEGKIVWYVASCGGIRVGEGNTLAVRPEKSATYYGRYETPAPCNHQSECAYVMVEVIENDVNPISVTASADTISQGESLVLTIKGEGEHEVLWSVDACDGYIIGTGSNLTVKPDRTTTYFGRYRYLSPCEGNSSCLSVTVFVKPKN